MVCHVWTHILSIAYGNVYHFVYKPFFKIKKEGNFPLKIVIRK